MKVLNLYAGIGGNRKLWNNCSVVAVEINESVAGVYAELFPADEVIVADAHEYLLRHYLEYDFVWTSPPCESHSVLNYFQAEKRFPDMRLYEEIIFLQNFCKCAWVVENVRGYYKPLIAPSVFGRHFIWSNKFIMDLDYETKADLVWDKNCDYVKRLGIDLKRRISGIRISKVYRNYMNPELGLRVFNVVNGLL